MRFIALLLIVIAPTVVRADVHGVNMEGADAPATDDSTLTPMGAERAGNADGSIPAWSGGLAAPPDNYDPTRHHVDPFASDVPLFRIDAKNSSRYANRLSEGQRALLAKYPDTWHMNVYPTRRTAAYPSFVYDAIRDNAQSSRLSTEGKGTVVGSSVTSPFREPTRAEEVMWNHLLRWRAIRVERSNGSAAVTPRGRYQVVLSREDLAFPYAAPNRSRDGEFSNVLLAAKGKTILPAALTGQGVLVLETIDQTHDPRKVWRYVPKLRQLLRQPNFGYAVPAPQTDALRTVDDFDLFSGPLDRFEWKLIGKQELFIPYNAYRVHSDAVEVAAIVGRNHPSPDLLRYELHRVWVVEATLKPNERHVYTRRMFYLDEDSWQIAVSDSWDRDGSLWRTAESHALEYYDVSVLWATLHVYHDLKKDRYLIDGLDNQRAPYRFSTTADPREFSPNALNYYVR